MNQRNDGGPAFPGNVAVGPNGEVVAAAMHGVPEGMTLRDHFASVALNGMLADHVARIHQQADPLPADVVARVAYSYADAMLVERAR